MKKISLLLVILHPLNSLALNIRPEDLYDYDFGEQPDLEEVLIHIGLSIMFALLMYGSIAIQEKAKNKIISRVGSIIAFICILGVAYNFLPCIATFWFWIIGFLTEKANFLVFFLRKITILWGWVFLAMARCQ